MIRRTRRVVCLLAIGFVINLVVGYACWARVCRYVDVTLYRDLVWTTTLDESDSGGFREEMVGRAFGWSGEYSVRGTTTEGLPDEIEPGALIESTRVRLEMAFGFPARTVGWTHSTLHEGRMREDGRARNSQTDLSGEPAWYFGGVETPFKRWPATVLPVDVWRVGTLVNSAVYAVLFALLSSVLRHVRRARRRRRGLCAGCGYEALGLPVCPECGSAC